MLCGIARFSGIKTWFRFDQKQVWSWWVLFFMLLFVVCVRFRLRDMPLERDEGEYAYVGQLLLQGVAPGKLAYTMKLPGTHAAYALLMVVFGQTCGGVHLGFLVVNCLTIFMTFLLGRDLLGQIAGCVAAATYGLLSLSGDLLGTSAHATHFVVLCVLAGLLLLWRAPKIARWWAYLGSGGLLSLSVFMKHNGLIFLLFGIAWLAWLAFRKRLGEKISFSKAGSMFLLGAVIPWLFLLLVLWRGGTLKNYWFWAVTYAGAYAKPNPGVMLVERMFMQRLPPVMQVPLYVSVFGLIALLRRRSSWNVALFASAFLLVSLISVVPGLYFRPHYFVLLIPAVAFGTGALVQEMAQLFAARWRYLSLLPIFLFMFFLVQGIRREKDFFFKLSPLEACRWLYGYQPFDEAIILGDYIRTHSAPDARVAVLGSEPEIYFYSRRHSATGYIYTYPLAERQPFADRMREQMGNEIAAARPQFIVQSRSWTSWLVRPGSPKKVRGLCQSLMPPGYQLIASCDVFPKDSRVEWNWHPDTRREPEDSTELLLFQEAAPKDAQP